MIVQPALVGREFAHAPAIPGDATFLDLGRNPGCHHGAFFDRPGDEGQGAHDHVVGDVHVWLDDGPQPDPDMIADRDVAGALIL